MNSDGLFAYQVEPTQQLLTAVKIHGSAIDASSCGIGKTFHAAAIIRELSIPSVVVCPKISISAWRNVLKTMGAKADVTNWEALRGGNTPFGRWDNPLPKKRPSKMVCLKCDCEVDVFAPTPCRFSEDSKHEVVPVAIPHKYGRFCFDENLRLVIFDEAHYAAGLDSLNADMVIASRRQHIKSLFLSATIADSPLGLRSVGFALGLHSLIGPAGFYPWAQRRGCRRVFGRGFQFAASEANKLKVMGSLHEALFPSHGVRVNSANVPGFPKCQVTAELYDFEKSGRIDELYEEMRESLELLNGTRSDDVNPENLLTRLLRASQEIELLKVPLFFSLREEAIANGQAVAIFVNYRETLFALQKKFKCVTVYGEQPPDERNEAIRAFQSNEINTIILTSAAGGVSISLHDLAGVPRLGLCSAHPSAVKMRQVFGRLARAGGLSPALYRIVLAAGTVEEKIHRQLSAKLNHLDALNDGDLKAANLPATKKDLADILGI